MSMRLRLAAALAVPRNLPPDTRHRVVKSIRSHYMVEWIVRELATRGGRVPSASARYRREPDGDAVPAPAGRCAPDRAQRSEAPVRHRDPGDRRPGGRVRLGRGGCRCRRWTTLLRANPAVPRRRITRNCVAIRSDGFRCARDRARSRLDCRERSRCRGVEPTRYRLRAEPGRGRSPRALATAPVAGRRATRPPT